MSDSPTAQRPVTLTGIRLANVRVFEGEHVIPIDPGLTVLMGRNNAGKSTVMRAPFLLRPGHETPEYISHYKRMGSESFEVGLQFHICPRTFSETFVLSADRLVPASLRSTESAEPVRELRAFANWGENPSIEVGARATSASQATAFVRAVGLERGTWIEATNGAPPMGVVAPESMPVSLVNGEWAQFALSIAPKVVPDVVLASWEHHRAARVSNWVPQSSRRITDTDDVRVQEVLTFLRLKYPTEFERVNRAVKAALPEFGDIDFIEQANSGFDYRPGFIASGGAERLLGRESIGSGVWSYLCILAAARAAKVTGARVLLLDEPQLYLHPGLESRLVDELLDPDLWDGAPLQIVAATHSPTFVNAAVSRGTLNILDWKDEARTSVEVTTFTHEKDGQFFDALTSPPSDLLYADKIVLVEGPSDVLPIRMLGRARCDLPNHVRFVPLLVADAVKSEIVRYFDIIVRAQGAGFRLGGLLILDGDKRAVETVWDKLEGYVDPRRAPGLEVVFADFPLPGPGERMSGNDLESLFCVPEFLVEYFVAKGLPRDSVITAVSDEVARIKYPSPSASGKGCAAIRKLHAALLGEEDNSGAKEDDLQQLTAFFIAHSEEAWSQLVKDRLRPIEDALKRLAAGARRAGT